MFEEIIAVVHSIGVTVMKLLPILLVLGIVFAVLTFFWACNPGRPWWRKRELVTDLCYWFVIPLFARYLRIGLLVLGAALLFGITTAGRSGRVLRRRPRAAGATAAVAAGGDLPGRVGPHDVLDPSRLPSSGDVEIPRGPSFLGGARLDLGGALPPGQHLPRQRATDVVLLLAGISPNVLVFLGPFTIAHSAFVHANLNWTLGPFKYVIAGPVFHRWHHTAADRGGEKNFASTFPVLDLMFGTFYMPKARLPDAYGVADPMPPTFGAQMIYPFRRSDGSVWQVRVARHLQFIHQFRVNSGP